MSDKDDWPTSYYSELLLDTLFEDFTSAEIKDLDVWYGKHEMQEEVYSVSYKITTDDKFLQKMVDQQNSSRPVCFMRAGS